jgi:hypothetical protein
VCAPVKCLRIEYRSCRCNHENAFAGNAGIMLVEESGRSRDRASGLVVTAYTERIQGSATRNARSEQLTELICTSDWCR